MRVQVRTDKSPLITPRTAYLTVESHLTTHPAFGAVRFPAIPAANIERTASLLHLEQSPTVATLGSDSPPHRLTLSNNTELGEADSDPAKSRNRFCSNNPRAPLRTFFFSSVQRRNVLESVERNLANREGYGRGEPIGAPNADT